MELSLLIFLIVQPISLCMYDTTTAFSLDDIAMVEKIENGTRKKAILRYGFHRTSECHDYEKAYICIQKCLDFHYDIAYADKNCYCTCYVNKEKSKYSAFVPGQQEKWKLGAPTTKIPIWAQKKKPQEKPLGSYPEDESTDIEDFPGNETDIISSNNTQVDTNTTQNVLENITVASNSTKIDNSSLIDGAELNDQINATVVENATTASQNVTA